MNIKLKYSSGKKKFNISKSRFPYVILPLIILAGIGPLIANQVINNDSQNPVSDTSTVESSLSASTIEEVSPSPSAFESSAAIGAESKSQGSESESGTAKASATPTKTPPYAVANQNFLIQIPRVQKLDPRATQLKLPQVNFYSQDSSYLMLCMNSSRGIIDIQAKGINDTFSNKDIFISGDLSTSVQIAGKSSQVLNAFNGFGGLQLKSPDGRSIVGTNLMMRFVAISEPTDDFALCDETSNAAQWNLELQPLGIQVNTKKNPVTLGDKTKNP